ncbi:unnamed protein product [Phaedon cochleariae]|uniref:NADH dehydrogenase [ubiquinone] 1 beta subcomplex subunit 11, mitochondrial n=1 Tax=Phaedon cochleariae TaxID=80249 RepID=A0A9N9X203_PHACE|nr:unnamed protein product [Phaedon cochleariae]
MAGIITLQRSLIKKFLPVINRRLVSTSKKNNDTVTAEVTSTGPAEAKSAIERNWMSYGYDFNSKEADRNAMHSIMFASITLCIAVFGFYLAYMPDYNLRDWSQREAFLELRRREALGLPLIDPNFINPDQIQLPSDDELGETEIII